MTPARSAAAAALASLAAFAIGDAVAAEALNAAGPLLSSEPLPLCAGTACACGIWLAWAKRMERSGSYRKGEEHGSARWLDPKDLRGYADLDDPDNNIILSQGCSIRLVDRTHDQATETNDNVMVVGGPGTGKTRYYVKPNLLQLNADFFITDPKGTLIHDMGWVFEDAGYDIKTFDTIDFSRSMKFNPIAYAKDERGILKLVECLISNTTGDDQHAGDPYWEKAERLLYTALLGYLVGHCPEEDRNVEGLLTLLSLADAREEDEAWKSPLDMLFDELETGMRLVAEPAGETYEADGRGYAREPSACRWARVSEPVDPRDDFGLATYRQFRVAAGKTMKSIISSCNVRMKPFDIKPVRDLMSRDEMGLSDLGDARRKTVVFASMSDTDSTFDFLFALLMHAALDSLCEAALERHGGSLPRPVHFMFDEFANIGRIPDFERMVTVTRSRNIAVSMILQSLSQLKEGYGDNNASTIVNACDTLLFLGGKANDTNREISEMVGKQTVSNVTVSDSRGSNWSTSRNYGTAERDLIQASEVSRLKRTQALVLVNGAQPVRDSKFDLDGHRRAHALAAAQGRGRFDVKAYWARREARKMEL